MAENLGKSQRDKRFNGRDSSVGPATHTSAAGRAFLAALRADAVTLSHRLRSAAARARQRSQIAKAVAAASTTKFRARFPPVVVGLLKLVKWLAVVAFVGSVAAE